MTMSNEELLKEIKKENTEILNRLIDQGEKNKDETKRHLGVLEEKFEKEVKAVGEGIDGAEQRLENKISELKTEMNQRFNDTDLAIRHLAGDVNEVKNDLKVVKDEVKKHDQKLANL